MPFFRRFLGIIRYSVDEQKPEQSAGLSAIAWESLLAARRLPEASMK
jgi:hypothetical protein